MFRRGEVKCGWWSPAKPLACVTSHVLIARQSQGQDIQEQLAPAPVIVLSTVQNRQSRQGREYRVYPSQINHYTLTLKSMHPLRRHP